jgi:Domain of unknown function (DUF4296)
MNRILILGVILISILLYSCKDRIPPTPIDEAKFINVANDLYIANAQIQDENPAIRDSMMTKYRAQIFTKHGTTQVAYDSTMHVFARYPKYLEKVYEKMLVQIKK